MKWADEVLTFLVWKGNSREIETSAPPPDRSAV